MGRMGSAYEVCGFHSGLFGGAGNLRKNQRGESLRKILEHFLRLIDSTISGVRRELAQNYL